MNPNDIAMAYGSIISKTSSDPDFKAQLMSDPKTALGTLGFNIPEGISVKVLESTADELYLALPPSVSQGQLSDAQLDQVSGGKYGDSSGKGNDYTPPPPGHPFG